MDRRAFLQGMAGILASGMAPAAIGSGILMPVRKIITLDMDLPMTATEVLRRQQEWLDECARRIQARMMTMFTPPDYKWFTLKVTK